ncbi:TRAP transporter substrate-binding protein [Phreatobacter stygius]|uniref:ABC transporter substrate-binding protein n=2 Tax=Pseudomonadota TaxID=1224 RepID=A0A4D7B888_9HYPH|nr:TRAP transporter substrate-binding protein [Phreatobacter stygius]QCI67063.1 ABC transporter substrate-binding protein [Phreatobacter stygius]
MPKTITTTPLTRRNAAVLSLAATAAVVASPAVAQSQPQLRWRMVTSYPKSLDTLDGGCRMLAKIVSDLTDGRFDIQVFAAGEVVPALAVLDAVQNGTVEMGHTASYYYVGKEPSLAFDTCLPFGLNARQQNAWMTHGGGAALMQELFAPYNIKVFPAGNTGAQMAGWFRKEIATVEDLRGLKFRTGGLVGQILTKLGVVPQQIAAGDIYPALERGTIDAAEWVGPHDDERLGLQKVARYYYAPGWAEGSAQVSLYVGQSRFDGLPPAYKSAVEQASAAVNTWMLGKYDNDNPAALRRLVASGAQIRLYSREVLTAAFDASEQLYAELSAKDPKFKKIFDAWNAYRREESLWFRVNELQFDSYMAFRLGRPG